MGKKELEEIIVGARNKARRTDVEKRVRGSTSERGKEKQQFFPTTTKLISMYCFSGCEQLYVKLRCTVLYLLAGFKYLFACRTQHTNYK
jgi:hypothetical protein